MGQTLLPRMDNNAQKMKKLRVSHAKKRYRNARKQKPKATIKLNERKKLSESCQKKYFIVS